MGRYLYNGVEYPALPDWDKKTYPYACMHFQGAQCFLYIFSEPKHLIKEITTGYMTTAVRAGESYMTAYAVRNGEFPEPKVNTAEAEGVYLRPDWANYDVQNSDGTIYLAASEPIPVGGEPIDPTSFMQGYIVWRRLAGMRK